MRRTKCGGWPYSQPPNVPFEINLASPQADGLVLWMPYGGGTPGTHRHVDRVRGLRFTEVGTPVWVADSEWGWSMLFDRASSECLVASVSLPSEPMTLACRARPVDVANGQYVLSTGEFALWNARFAIRCAGNFANDPIHAYKSLPGTTVFAATTTGYSANTWHHLCAVFPATDSRAAYIDGGSKGTNATATGAVTPNQIRVANRGSGGAPEADGYFDGRILDWRVYNVAKTDTEVYEMATEPWELWKPLIRRWSGWKSPVVERMPRYGFTNFQVPGIV